MGRATMAALAKRYGVEEGATYQDLLNAILARNTEAATAALGRRREERYRKALADQVRGGKLVLPAWSEVMPNGQAFARKAQESGELISQTLRTRLASDLRHELLDFKDKQGRPGYVRQAGAAAGRVDPELISRFEARITGTFFAYSASRRSPDGQVAMPSNIHTIAVTEVRGQVDELKWLYAKRIIEANPGAVVATKRWAHHPTLSREPRPGHRMMNGKQVAFDKPFMVPGYEKKGKRWVRTGRFTAMLFPHDPKAPAGEVIGCNCDYDILLTVKDVDGSRGGR